MDDHLIMLSYLLKSDFLRLTILLGSMEEGLEEPWGSYRAMSIAHDVYEYDDRRII